MDAADGFGERRAQHRGEIDPSSFLGAQARPLAGAGADADIEGLAAEIDQRVRGVHAHGDIGMGELEEAELPGQPL